MNRDRVGDLGQLAEGTTQMRSTTHPRRNHPDEYARRPRRCAPGKRDTNADGGFDSRDVYGTRALNDTMNNPAASCGVS